MSGVAPPRLSYSKNGVIRMDGFSNPEQFDQEALALWLPGVLEESLLERGTARYILGFIGDKFCQMVSTENSAASWVRKEGECPALQGTRGEVWGCCSNLHLHKGREPQGT